MNDQLLTPAFLPHERLDVYQLALAFLPSPISGTGTGTCTSHHSSDLRPSRCMTAGGERVGFFTGRKQGEKILDSRDSPQILLVLSSSCEIRDETILPVR